ncbi:unnamed protein product [Owenia fusiformis]|uniref:Major facilitator superfamily (MFS) profile domain-containing protein n=1 Tax=Owenia fusiformis TaxID=6347 RepID=A0A8S4MY83_OWEFU|nr:unnamed protein product [Owenia fusiformis]
MENPKDGEDVEMHPVNDINNPNDKLLNRQRHASRASTCSQRSQRSLKRLDSDVEHTIDPDQKGVSKRKISVSRPEYHEHLKGIMGQGLSINLVFTAFIICFGSSFIIGYNIGVLNQPANLIQDFYNYTYNFDRRPDANYGVNGTDKLISQTALTTLWSLSTTFFLLGGMLGNICVGFVAEKIGRKWSIMVAHIFAFIGSAIMTPTLAARSPEMVMIGRFFIGINCGLSMGLAPMFLSEITPVNLRGAFGTCHQLAITIGIFLSSVFGLEQLLGTVNRWPYLLLLNIVPAFVSLVILPFLPESPRYLFLAKRQQDLAKKSLQFYRKRDNVSAEIEEMETEAHAAAKVEAYSMKKVLTDKSLRWPLIICVALQAAQQLSGINAIFFYSGSIFENAQVKDIPMAVLGTNAVNVGMTIVSVLIMDKLGRRVLLIFPMGLMIFTCILITVSLSLQDKVAGMSYVSIGCVIGYVIGFAVGLGPIPLMIGAELFRQGPRPQAMALGGLMNWFCNLLISISFPLIQESLKQYTFIIFIILLTLFLVFIIFKVPETKNRTIEEIANDFAPDGEHIAVEEVMDDNAGGNGEMMPLKSTQPDDVKV